MIDRFGRKVWGSWTLFRELPAQRRIGRLPAERLRAIRDARIRKLIAYAAKTVPYYRDLFRAKAIDPRDIRTAADLDELPTLSKDAVGNDPDAFISQSRLGRRSVPFQTSGSTGTSLRIHRDERSLIANLAHCELEKQILRDFLNLGRRARQMAIVVPTTTIKRISAAYQDLAFFVPQNRTKYVSVDDPIEKITEQFNDYQPDILTGYGSSIEQLFRSAAAQRVTLYKPKLVLYTGDALTEDGRQLIETEFAVPVFSRYNAIESFRLGYTCVERTGFHLRDDLCHVKILGPDGSWLPRGQSGEITLTNLVNFGTVLINYRIGDVGTLATADCRCGSGFPLLERLEGRVEDIVRLPTGQTVHPRSVYRVIRKLPAIRRYQLVQTSPTHFRLQVVVQESADAANGIAAVESEMQMLLAPATLSVERVAAIPPGTGGKFRSVISHPSKTTVQ